MPGIRRSHNYNLQASTMQPPNKVKSYDETIKYVPPPITGSHKGTDFAMQSTGMNPYMHLDPYGYLNQSIYPDVMQNEQSNKGNEVSVFSARNKSNVDRLSIGRISKHNVGDIGFEHMR